MGFFKNLISGIFGKKESETNYKEASLRYSKMASSSYDVDKTIQISIEPPRQQYIVKMDGKYQVFNSKKDMPVELRENVEEVEKSESSKSSYTVIVDGKRKTFSSLKEMPSDIRKALEKSEA